jgi:hypothetical protein
MRPAKKSARLRVVTPVAAALAMLSIAPSASAGGASHRLELDTSMFAARVGSTTTGGNVDAGALVDARLGHGAIVFSTIGTNKLRVTFHMFFARGSIDGSGTVTLARGGGGHTTLSGPLRVSGGTAAYANAQGRLVVAGTTDKTGMVFATLSGSFTY